MLKVIIFIKIIFKTSLKMCEHKKINSNIFSVPCPSLLLKYYALNNNYPFDLNSVLSCQYVLNRSFAILLHIILSDILKRFIEIIKLLYVGEIPPTYSSARTIAELK